MVTIDPMAEAATKAGEATRERLIKTVLALAEDQAIDEIRVEQVLEKSGVATGSLYHHFDDFGHLIETAMAERYVEILRHGLVLAGAALDQAEDYEDLKRRMLEASYIYVKLNTPALRYERARILARAEHSDRLRQVLGEAQQELTDSLTEMFARAQRPAGLLDPDIDPRSIAVFMQAYTFGRLVDDIVPNRMEQEKWQHLVINFFMRTLVGDPDADA